MNIEPITITFTPTLEFLKDIAITAAEGGIQYWAYLETYKWRDVTKASAEEHITFESGIQRKITVETAWTELPFPELKLFKHEDCGEEAEGTATLYTVTPETIRKGLELAIQRPGSLIDLALVIANDSSGLDAGDADNIVQLGLFGEIVYG